MSELIGERATPAGRGVRGRIRRRLLINGLVDPDEAAARLPEGVRPHATPTGTVVGCCLLELDDVRPGILPKGSGWALRAAAHRISVEWTSATGAVETGVYVPVRLTDSRAATLLGGRVFPGVHRRVRLRASAADHTVRWQITDSEYSLDVTVDVKSASADTGDAVGATCLGADLGISPRHRSGVEVVRMDPETRDARRVEVDNLRSDFLDTFRSLRPAASYLMENVDVTWTADPNRPGELQSD